MARPLRSLASVVVLLGACGAPPTSTPDGATTPDAGAPLSDAPTLPDAPPSSDTPGCVALAPATSDVLWVVDRSGTFSTRLDRRAGAADAVVASVGAWTTGAHAMSVFPVVEAGADSCDVADYGVTLDFGADAAAIGAAIGGHVIDGGSPLGVALEAAIDAAVAAREPGREVAVILVTDAAPGEDESCGADDWDAVTAIAATGPRAGVHVHVLSIVGTASSPVLFGRIGRIATGGDGFAGVVNGSRTDIARSAGDFLRAVREHMEGCAFDLGGRGVPAAAELVRGDGTTTMLTRVTGPEACTPTGFYADTDGTTVRLCSGEGGVGGLCQGTYLAARTMGAPTFLACE